MTKAQNYRKFLDLGGRVLPKTHAPVNQETLEWSSKLGSGDILVKCVVGGGSPRRSSMHRAKVGNSHMTYSEVWLNFLERHSRDIIWDHVYSAGGSAVIRPLNLKSSSDFDLLREKVRRFSELPVGWDSYDGTAPPREAIEVALKVIDALELTDILPDWVVPSSDSSILMSATTRGTLLKWEIDSDGDVAVMLKPKFSPATYHDLELSEIDRFLKQIFQKG